jgi:hypothetical protein
LAVPLGEHDDDDASALASSQSRNDMPYSSGEASMDDLDADFGPEPWLQEAFDIVDGLVQLLPVLRVPFEESISSDPAQHDVEGHSPEEYQQIAHELFPSADGALLKRLAQTHWRTRWSLPGPLNTTDMHGNLKAGMVTSKRASMPRSSARRQGWTTRRTKSTFQASTRGSDGGTSTIRSHVETVMSRTAIVDQNSTTSVGASSHSNHIHRPTVPDPPIERDRLGLDQFDCPYCHCELPIIVGASGMSHDDWANHFYQDMKPYICTFGDCRRRDIPFGSREEWFRHELDFHRTPSLWACGACPAKYGRQDDFIAHLQSTHEGLIVSRDVSLLTQSCKRLSHMGTPAEACILCHGVCRSLEELESHLGSHMEAFVIETARESEPSTGDDQETEAMVLEYISEQMNLHAPVVGLVDDDHTGNGNHMAGAAHHADADRFFNSRNLLNDSEQGGSEFRRTGSDWNEKVTSYLDGQLEAIGTVHHNLPSQYENFAGREQNLLNMHEYLSTPGRLCTVSGRSGIGKTATAVQYAYRYSNEFSYVFWVEAETAGILADQYEAIADALDLNRDGNREDNSTIFLVRDALSKLDRRWLLVFDNVDVWTDVSPYITKALARSKGSVLITTRADPLRSWPNWLHQRTVRLGPLEPEDGRKFLLTAIYPRTRKDDLENLEDYELAGKTVRLLEGLPLAISMVIGYVKESRCSLVDFHEMWDEKEAKRSKPTRVTTAGAETIDSTIDALWEIGIREVPQDCRKLLDIMSFLDPDSIPKSLLVGDHEEEYLDLLNADETLRFDRPQETAMCNKILTINSTDTNEQSGS